MRSTAWGTVAALSLAFAGEAAAQPSTAPRARFRGWWVDAYARLTYERKQGAGLCPGEDFLRTELARRLGYDPFTPNPEGVAVGDVRIVVAPDPGGFVVRSDWTHAPDYPEASHRFTRQHCGDAIVDIAIVLRASFMIYSMRYGQKYAPKPPACPAPAVAERTAPACPEYRFAVWPPEWPMAPLGKPKPSPPKPLERWPSALRFGVAMGPELVATGWASFGLSASFGARFRAVSLDFEAHGDPALGSISFPGLGTVSSARVSGALALCAHIGLGAACGLADAGRILFPDHVQVLPASTFYGAAGVRLRLEVPIVPPRLLLSTDLDLRAPIRQAHFTYGTTTVTTVFDSAAPGVRLGFGLLLELPP
jgi:hypothetical protein